MVVGLNVQRLRRERDISQEEVSLRSGRTRGYLSGIENGGRNPTILVLASLAKALESDVSELFVKPKKITQSIKSASAEAGGRVKKPTSKPKRQRARRPK